MKPGRHGGHGEERRRERGRREPRKTRKEMMDKEAVWRGEAEERKGM
jgi:hypothetical protein